MAAIGLMVVACEESNKERVIMKKGKVSEVETERNGILPHDALAQYSRGVLYLSNPGFQT